MTDTNAALRGALHDMLAATAFLTFCIRNGRSPSVDDHRLLGERYEKARAALVAEADRGTCGNCHHASDAHSPVNRETCAMPGCDCPGLLTVAEADRGTPDEQRLAGTWGRWLAEVERIRAEAVDRWLASPDAVGVMARAFNAHTDNDPQHRLDGPHAGCRGSCAAPVIKAMRREMEEPR